ncbi:hypothetical protein FQN55_002692 [Onygenales sp. PD_40]|nr:hypothetical protein FQN55_002692 [Onygenales sp. PD_40]
MAPDTPIPIIPIIPLTQPRPSTISAIRSACLTHGFFQITHSSIPTPLQTRLLHLMKTYFALPEPFKLSTPKNDHIHGGYERFRKYSLQAGRGKPDLNEGYCIAPGYVDDDDDDDVGDAWPEETAENGLLGFRATCREYYDVVGEQGRKLAGLIAEGLGLDRSYFDAYFARQMAHCRLMHYYAPPPPPPPPHPEQDPMAGSAHDDNIGAGLHTDWGLITLLLQDSVGGLQVLDPGTDSYIPVPPTPGAYVVNCGDLLSRFTNGVYTSARHRVVAPPSGTDRYSVAFFCDGNPEYTVDVLPMGAEWKGWVEGRRGLAPQAEKLYEPIKAGVYFEKKWVESAGGGKKDAEEVV